MDRSEIEGRRIAQDLVGKLRKVRGPPLLYSIGIGKSSNLHLRGQGALSELVQRIHEPKVWRE